MKHFLQERLGRLVLLAGVVCGFGIIESRRASDLHKRERFLRGASLPAETERFDRTRTDVSRRILGQLHVGEMSDRDRRLIVNGLRYLPTREVAAWLVDHHDYSYLGPLPEEMQFKVAMIFDPCRDALHGMGGVAVPKMVEAYLTQPSDRGPDFLLSPLRSSSRMAYVYAQGYLFSRPENGHHRDLVIRLVRQVVPGRGLVDLPYPPAWFGVPEWKRP